MRTRGSVVAEQLARFAHPLEIHLLYASIVWLVAWLLTSMRIGSAATKYWIWVATSLYFVLPLNAMLALVGTPRFLRMTPLNVIRVAAGVTSKLPFITALLIVWVLGAVVMLLRLCLRVRADRLSGASEKPGFVIEGIGVGFGRGPAVEGILRPRISLPAGIERLLSKDELDAVIIHELQHARRRDNLVRLVYEVSLCALWFHPLVWFAGSRLALYRELSCDESVIRRARGEDLVSALAKLAIPGEVPLLNASASSLITHRLQRLTELQRASVAANLLLALAFGAVLLSSVLGAAALGAESATCIPPEISEIQLVRQAIHALH